MKLGLRVLTGCLALAASASAPLARAGTEVKFIEPEKFSDLRDNNGFRQLDLLKDLETHFVTQAAKRLPGQDLKITVTDVDLAGEVEPWGHRGQWLRVMRAVTSPAISLSYELLEGGQVIRRGEARLRDFDYQNELNFYASGDPLRYERRMIDRWMDREFGAKVATAPKP